MKVTARQMSCIVGDTEANTSKIVNDIKYIASELKSDVAVFPEMCDTGYHLPTIKAEAQNWANSKGTFNSLCSAAKTNSINVIAGISERVDSDIYNTTVVINRSGDLIAKYRKTHLFTMEPVCEHKTITQGDELVVCEIEGVPVGLMTCYEIRFPEVARKLTFSGAKIIFVTSAFGLHRLIHWQILNRARAIENQIFVVTSNRVGNDKGFHTSGSSAIYDPWGVVKASASEVHESYVTSELDLELVNAVRQQVKIHQDVRNELY